MEIRKWIAKHILRLNYQLVKDEGDAMYSQAKFFEERSMNYEKKYQAARKEANDLMDKIGSVERINKMNESAVKELLQEIDVLKKDPIRNRLGSIEFSQVHDPLNSLDEGERKNYVSQIFANRRLWKDEIEWLMKDQIEWWARNSLGGMFRNEAEQNAFARGNINFGDLLLKRVEDIVQEHVEHIEEEKSKNAGTENANSAPLSSEAGLDVLNLVNQVKI